MWLSVKFSPKAFYSFNWKTLETHSRFWDWLCVLYLIVSSSHLLREATLSERLTRRTQWFSTRSLSFKASMRASFVRATKASIRAAHSCSYSALTMLKMLSKMTERSSCPWWPSFTTSVLTCAWLSLQRVTLVGSKIWSIRDRSSFREWKLMTRCKSSSITADRSSKIRFSSSFFKIQTSHTHSSCRMSTIQTKWALLNRKKQCNKS